jgi:ankyrin repeat protein
MSRYKVMDTSQRTEDENTAQAELKSWPVWVMLWGKAASNEFARPEYYFYNNVTHQQQTERPEEFGVLFWSDGSITLAGQKPRRKKQRRTRYSELSGKGLEEKVKFIEPKFIKHPIAATKIQCCWRQHWSRHLIRVWGGITATKARNAELKAAKEERKRLLEEEEVKRKKSGSKVKKKTGKEELNSRPTTALLPNEGWFDLEDFYLQQTIYFHPGKLSRNPGRFPVEEIALGAKMAGYDVKISWKRPYETPEETKARLKKEAEIEQKRLDLGLITAGRIGNVHEAKQWHRQGANPRARDERVGFELAHFAAARGLMNVLFWLTNECKVNLAHVRDHFGATCLHHAAKVGRLNVMKYLVNKCNVDPHEADTRGRTALLYASHGCHLECVRWLREDCKVDISSEDISGCTAAHRVVTSPMCHKNVERVNHVLEYLAGEGLNMEEDDHWGNTPIDKAASCDNIEIVNELRRHGCNTTNGPNDKDPDKVEGWGPMHKAAMLGEAQRIRWLHKRGVDVNSPDKRNETPLHHACAGGHFEAIQTLLRCGVIIDGLKNNINQTPEDLAIKQGFPECAKLINDTRDRIERNRIRVAREEAKEMERQKEEEELQREMERIAAVERALGERENF